MTELISLSENEFELIKITLKTLNKFRKFDTVRVYETDRHFEIHTVNRSEKYVTRTKIGKCSWRVSECIYHKAGEKEIQIK
jgi:hypothetical protein